MTRRIKETTVEGRRYRVWSDTIMRGTYACNEAGETKRIYGGGYITNDLTIRKAIAANFGHQSFKK